MAFIFSFATDFSFSGLVTFISDWILATGFWNDAGVWEDTAVWLD